MDEAQRTKRFEDATSLVILLFSLSLSSSFSVLPALDSSFNLQLASLLPLLGHDDELFAQNPHL